MQGPLTLRRSSQVLFKSLPISSWEKIKAVHTTGINPFATFQRELRAFQIFYVMCPIIIISKTRSFSKFFRSFWTLNSTLTLLVGQKKYMPLEQSRYQYHLNLYSAFSKRTWDGQSLWLIVHGGSTANAVLSRIRKVLNLCVLGGWQWSIVCHQDEIACTKNLLVRGMYNCTPQPHLRIFNASCAYFPSKCT